MTLYFSGTGNSLAIARKIAEAINDQVLPLTISEIGATPDMIDNIVSTTVLFPAGYLDLTAEDVKEILVASL